MEPESILIIMIMIIIIIIITILIIIITKKFISLISGVFRAWSNIYDEAKYI